MELGFEPKSDPKAYILSTTSGSYIKVSKNRVLFFGLFILFYCFSKIYF